MTVDLHDPTTWPADTIVVRCGSAQGVQELAERLSRDGSWSVFTGVGVPFAELARSCRNNQVRRTTVGAILEAGGSLRPSSGPPNHHDLYGLTPPQFDAILGLPEPNPVSKTGSLEPVMITLQADFNHLDDKGRLRLEDLRMHGETPFAEIAAKHESIIFVDGEDMVRGELTHDAELGWIGKVDWSTQDVWESYPPAIAARS